MEVYDEFERYIRATEPGPKERAELWQTAIGLQKVDGLEVSDYLIATAKKHIEGEVSIDGVDKLITTYYQSEAKFISGLWQIHPFPEGNTRTTAVFTIKYLRSMGYKVENDMFKSHSWYFRNALVRSNYRNAIKGIEPTDEYLVLFFRNLLLSENNDLKNRYLHICWDASKRQNDVSEATKRQNDVSFPQLSMKENAVLGMIAVNHHISIDEIAAAIGMSASTIDRIIKALKSKGIVERKGQKNNSEWIIKTSVIHKQSFQNEW